jgi:GcrA cell cycle regulator
MTQPNGFRGRRSAKEWTAADDERLRDLLVKGMSAREIGIELNCTAVAVRSRAFRLNLLERKPVVSQIGTWEKKLGLKAKKLNNAATDPETY